MMLEVKWADDRVSTDNLVGWIAIGDETLASLKTPEIWAAVTVADYGTMIE